MAATFGGTQTSLGGRREGNKWIYDDGSTYDIPEGAGLSGAQVTGILGADGVASNAPAQVTNTPSSVSYGPAPAPAPTYAQPGQAAWGGSTLAPAPAPGAGGSGSGSGGGAVFGGTNPNAPAPSPAPGAPAPAPSTGGGIIQSAMSGAAQLGNPNAWNVTADQTVEGRLNNLTNPNSPIIAQARARAAEQMAARGLQNSSMALGAADAAAYDVALPIAQADAATAAKAAGYNVDQSNQFAVRNTDYDNQFRLQDKADAQAREIALINRETQKQLTTLDASLRAQADAIATQNKTMLETNAQAASAFNTAMSAINNIQNNNQMDADAKTMAVANVWRDLQTQMKVMGAVAGLDLTSQLSFVNYPGFDANGNFVGFEDGPGARTRGATPAPSPGAAPAPAPQPGDPGYQPDYGGSGD